MKAPARIELLCGFCLLLAWTSGSALGDELWQIDSTASVPGGPPLTQSESQCMPQAGMDPSRALPGVGDCTFLHKQGNASAMTFELECRLPGTPTEIPAIRVAGDARLAGEHFDMRYTVHMGQEAGAAGSDFTLTGSVVARRTGSCTPH